MPASPAVNAEVAKIIPAKSSAEQELEDLTNKLLFNMNQVSTEPDFVGKFGLKPFLFAVTMSVKYINPVNFNVDAISFHYHMHNLTIFSTSLMKFNEVFKLAS